MPMTRADLDALECNEPGCTKTSHEVHLSGVCHPRMPSNVVYKNGTLIMSCAICNEVVAEVSVGGDGKTN